MKPIRLSGHAREQLFLGEFQSGDRENLWNKMIGMPYSG